MRISKVRNSPRIVLKSTLEQSELNYDEVLKTDVNSDGFADKYIVTDELDGENSNGEQRIYADEVTQSQEFIFTPDTEEINDSVVSIDKVEVNRLADGDGRTPEWKAYGTTLVNLLGNYGNFENDSNSDGLADGWTNDAGLTAVANAIETTNKTFGSKAQKVTLSADGEGGNYIEVTVAAAQALFVAGYIRAGDTSTTGKLIVDWRDNANTQISTDTVGTRAAASYARVSAALTAPANAVKARIYATVAGVSGKQAYFDGIQVHNLTAQGALDSIRAAKYSETNWSDLTEAQLEAEISYFDSVMSVNVEDGTASELTIENRGKNLIDFSYPASATAITELIPTGLRIYNSDAGAFRRANFLMKAQPGTFTLSTDVTVTTGYAYIYAYAYDINRERLSITTYLAKHSATSDRFEITSTLPEKTAFVGIDFHSTFNISTIGDVTYSNIQLEEGSAATAYVPPRTDSLTIPDTCELHGYAGNYDYVDNYGRYTKNIERTTTTTDASGEFVLTGYKPNTTVLIRNTTDDTVQILDAADTVSTGWNETLVEYWYVLSTSVESIETLEGALKVYQGSNNILVPDSNIPTPIQITHVDNEVATVTNLVNIENIVKTCAYEWNAGTANWTLSGRALVNLIYSGDNVPDGEGRYFKCCDGNTYIDILNETTITGDNTYKLVTNSSGDAADMAVYNLTSMMYLTEKEAARANVLAGEELYDTDTLWEELPAEIIVDMLYYVPNYTKEYASSILNTRSGATLSEVNFDLHILSLLSNKNIINSDGTGTKHVWLDDLSGATFTHIYEGTDCDYVQLELDADIAEEIEDFEIGVVWDYSSDVSTLSRDLKDLTIETFWNYSSDVSTLRRQTI